MKNTATAAAEDKKTDNGLEENPNKSTTATTSTNDKKECCEKVTKEKSHLETQTKQLTKQLEQKVSELLDKKTATFDGVIFIGNGTGSEKQSL